MKLFTEIYEAMRDKFLSGNSSLTNFNVNSRMRALLEAIAEALEEIWFYEDSVLQALFVETAKGTYLDKRATELGLTRLAAQKAYCPQVRFTGTASTVIPAGTVISTGSNTNPEVEFVTLEEVTIHGGETTVDTDVEAKIAGSSGNVITGAIDTLVSVVSGLSAVENLQPASGGADAETDAELRTRIILKWYASSYGPTNNTIRSWCLEVRGVADARVVGNFPAPGKAAVLIWSRNEEGALTPASSDLVAQVQVILDERRPVCFILTATIPTGILVDVETAIEVAGGYTFTDVSEAVKAAIEDYFSNLSVGDDVLVAGLLYTVMGVAGVANAAITAPTADVIIGVSDSAILGDNIISEL